MAQRTLLGGVVPKPYVGKKGKSNVGDSYINIQGNGKIVVKAKSKEEAMQKAREMFELELRRCDIWDTKDKMMERWRGLMGAELKKTSSTGIEGVEVQDLKWKNNPKQSWIRNSLLW